MIDGIVGCRGQRATIDSDCGRFSFITITCYRIPSRLDSTTINGNLAATPCTYAILTIVCCLFWDNGVNMTALHHKLAIRYIYYWCGIDETASTHSIRGLSIYSSCTVFLGVLKSKLA